MRAHFKPELRESDVVHLTQKKFRRRSNTKFALRLAFLIALASILATLSHYLVFRSALFSVKYIHVQGLDQLNESLIVELSEIKPHDQLFGFKLDDVEKRIEKHPYIRQVEVRRKNHNTVNIVVIEREEYAIIPYMGSYVTLDEEMFVLKISDGVLSNNLSVVTGIEFTSLTIGQQAQAVNTESLGTAFRVLGAAKEAEIIDIISEVNLDQNGQVTIVIFNGIEARLGYVDNPAYTMLALKEAVITLHTRDMKDVIIDMRYEGHMTVRQRSRQEAEHD